MATVTGTPTAVADLLAAADLPEATEVLGPVPVPGREQEEAELERMLLRAPRAAGARLAAALHAAAGVRSARKVRDPVRIQIDPVELW